MKDYFVADPADLRKAFGCYPTGVAVVTAISADGTPVGMTVNSLTSVSLAPPVLSWCIRLETPSYETFTKARNFGVSILAHDQENLCRKFSRPSADKFANVCLQYGRSGVPLLDSAVAVFECEAGEHFLCGDHAIVIGIVVDYAWRAQCSPLVFYRGSTFAGEQFVAGG